MWNVGYLYLVGRVVGFVCFFEERWSKSGMRAASQGLRLIKKAAAERLAPIIPYSFDQGIRFDQS